MALTPSQAKEQNIVRSLYDYLDSSITTAYNADVASTNYNTPFGLALQWPDDPSVSPTPPVIIIDPPTDTQPQMSAGMGDGVVWKCKLFHLYCFPAVTNQGQPSLTAASILRGYTDYAMGTGLYIPIYDYSSGKVHVDDMRVIDSRQVKGFPTQAPLLALEKHRYDYLLTVTYQVQAIHG